MRFALFISCLLLACPALAERKSALIIGNGNYAGAAQIEGVAEEVQSIAESLIRLGFSVRYDSDLTLAGMQATLESFAATLGAADTAIFYYAGHGLQFAGQNHLIPIGAKLRDEASIGRETLALAEVLEGLEAAAETRTIFLDTCHDNPFQADLVEALGPARASEVLGDCLAPVETRPGTFVGFADQPETMTALIARSDCAVCPETVTVPAGDTIMGSDTGTAAEKPEVAQQIASFQMTRAEITVGDIRRYEAATGRQIPRGCFVWTAESRLRSRADAYWGAPGHAVTDASPAACLSWEDAQAYVDWLNEEDSSGGWRLPSEAEFEYAARAGLAGDYPWDGGAAAVCENANGADASSRFRWRNRACRDAAAQTAHAEAFPANAFGLHHMIGNLWEWTADCWNGSHRGARADGLPRTNGTCASRVLRGASWDDPIENLRAPYRVGIPSTRRQANVGFRLVKDLR